MTLPSASASPSRPASDRGPGDARVRALALGLPGAFAFACAFAAAAQDLPPAAPFQLTPRDQPAASAEAPTPGVAPPFLFINQEQILTGSRSGKEILADEDRQRDALRGESRALDASFEEEESRLTEERPKLAPEEFRKLSDAFDARVVKARRDQDERASALADRFDQRRRQFYAQVAPILVMLMDRYGAKAIFDENSVLLADQSLNITQAVIAEIDARAATAAPEGTAPAPAAGPAAPDPGAAPAPATPETDGNAGGE
jgi:Skp family chaperone for outer membrane proteins